MARVFWRHADLLSRRASPARRADSARHPGTDLPDDFQACVLEDERLGADIAELDRGAPVDAHARDRHDLAPAELRMPHALAKLSPFNIEEHILYGRVLDVLILAIGAAWYWILRMRRRIDANRGLPSVVLGLTILAGLILLLVFPYRIIWHNAFERVTFGNDRCYQIGERSGQLLLYCPEVSPPRNRVVSSTDPAVKRERLVESIFTPPATR